MTPLSIRTAYGNAARVFGRNLGIVVFFALVVGALGAMVADFVAAGALDLYTGGRAVAQTDRAALVVSEIPRMLAVTFWQGIFGALGAAASIYLWVSHERQRPASLHDAINYAINRFGRIWRPHMAAFAIIFWGGQLLVPGILFGLQYAYTDAVAVLDEKETNPRGRSRALTRPRRGAVFRALAPFGLWWIGYPLLLTFVLQEQGLWMVAAGGAVDHLVNVFVDLVMVQLYIDEVRRRIVRADEKKRVADAASQEPAVSLSKER